MESRGELRTSAVAVHAAHSSSHHITVEPAPVTRRKDLLLGYAIKASGDMRSLVPTILFPAARGGCGKYPGRICTGKHTVNVGEKLLQHDFILGTLGWSMPHPPCPNTHYDTIRACTTGQSL
mmetsp:Transcript_61166/g.136244  ORF Transcript_61166/g.136244 Transcript_61166/m.136244 type:complete len:122 (-) Transcript_61166:246-611(-)